MENTLNPLLSNDLLCYDQPEDYLPSHHYQTTNIASLLLLSPTSFNIQHSISSPPNSQQILQDLQVGTSSINTDIPYSNLSSPKSQEFSEKESVKQNYNSIHRWNKSECQSYDKFIQLYLDVILERGSESNSKIQIKRNKNLFQMMSKFIGTRDVTQCRSHHQKFFRKALMKLGINQDECQFPVVKKIENVTEGAKPVKKVQIKRKLSINNMPEIKLPEVENPKIISQVNPLMEKIQKSK